jgi:hypothetical protein
VGTDGTYPGFFTPKGLRPFQLYLPHSKHSQAVKSCVIYILISKSFRRDILHRYPATQSQ